MQIWVGLCTGKGCEVEKWENFGTRFEILAKNCQKNIFLAIVATFGHVLGIWLITAAQQNACLGRPMYRAGYFEVVLINKLLVYL